MDSQHWKKVNDLFFAALDCEPERRDQLVADACSGDDQLRAEVHSLLASHFDAGNFIATPAFDIGARLLINSPSDASGTRIGPYRVLREIGSGGMGAVFLAVRDDDQYQKQVAIKIVRGGLHTDFLLRRFRSERQILANLEHPNIARLLDGGTTTDGVPYLVMEFIEGQTIYEYCDGQRLSIQERLRLFRTVCSAVHYAHQSLVIHRDIKPSNILITSAGVPKLLDFGIAKLVQSDAPDGMEATVTAVPVMTPEYASPEQLRGEAVTTAADIYSLGVLLYELLSGRRPYRLKSRSPHEIAKLVCETEPERPSATIYRAEETTESTGRSARTIKEIGEARREVPTRLGRRLAGDLDNIVLMAMRKEPQRRYASVEQFSEDIRRHLDGLPVSARKDTVGYRAAKFVRRNKAGVTIAAVMSLALLAALIATAWEAHVARVQRVRAEQHFRDVRQLANSFLFEFHDSIKYLPGATPIRALLVKRALVYLDGLAQEGKDDPSLQRELGTAYFKVGDVQGNPNDSNLGDAPGALQSYRKALAIREALATTSPNNKDIQLELAATYDRIASLTASSDEARRMYHKALSIREPLALAQPDNVPLQLELAIGYENIGNISGNPYYDNLGDTSSAIEYLKKTLSISEALFRANPSSSDVRAQLFDSYHGFADALWATGHLAEALRYERMAQRLMEELIAADPNNTNAKSNWDVGQGRVAAVLQESGLLAESLEVLRASSKGADLTVNDPHNAFYQRHRASGWNDLGALYLKMGDARTAVNLHSKALEASQRLMTLDPASADSRRRLANSLEGLGNALAARENLSQALQNSQNAVQIREALVAQNPSSRRMQDLLASNYVSFGTILMRAGKTEEAHTNYKKARAIREVIASTDHLNWLNRRSLVNVYLKIAEADLNLASKAHRAPGSELYLRETCSGYRNAQEIWEEMRKQGTLIPSDAEKISSTAAAEREACR